MADHREHITELASELALGTVSGEERAGALQHMARCAECRKLVLELSTIADQLLELTPSHEPPVGFESRVLARLTGRRVSRPRRWLVSRAAAAFLAAVVASSLVLWVTADDRRTAGRYRQALAQAEGEYFAVYDIYDPGDREVGYVFAYQGDPSWLYVVMRDGTPGDYATELVTDAGHSVTLRDLELAGGVQGWGSVIPVAVHDVGALRMTGRDGLTYASPFE